MAGQRRERPEGEEESSEKEGRMLKVQRRIWTILLDGKYSVA